MCTTTDPATAAEALGMLEAALGTQRRALVFLAAQDAAALPAQAVADQLRALERADAAGAALRGRLLEVFDSQDGHLAADGGHTSLTNLKDYCWWHHHVVLHELGWTLTVHPDGTSQVQSPDGTIIRSHSPPPRPG